MRNSFFITFLLFNLNLILGQNIDQLNSYKQVAKFLKSTINKKYTFKEVFDREVEADQEDFEFFVKKIDLDNNGYTDLIVDAYVPVIIILNYGNEKFKEVDFNRDGYFEEFDSDLNSILEIGDEKILIFEKEIPYDNIEYPNIIIKKDQEVLTINQTIDFVFDIFDDPLKLIRILIYS
jgi:hypothetical protein